MNFGSDEVLTPEEFSGHELRNQHCQFGGVRVGCAVAGAVQADVARRWDLLTQPLHTALMMGPAEFAAHRKERNDH